MSDDTSIGGPSGRFPATRWSAILAARSADPGERARALDSLLAAYWKPVYKYLRLRWGQSNEDAKDLTQEFFARLIEKHFLDDYDPERARLRTFLRTCVDALVANQDKAARRLKRGGGVALLSLDFDAAEAECAATSAEGTMDAFFEREWVRSLFSLAVDRLRADCAARGRAVHFRLFELYDLEKESWPQKSYQDLAAEFGIAVSDVTNYLALARREFRRIVLETLREMTANENEFRREARSLLGMDAE